MRKQKALAPAAIALAVLATSCAPAARESAPAEGAYTAPFFDLVFTGPEKVKVGEDITLHFVVVGPRHRPFLLDITELEYPHRHGLGLDWRFTPLRTPEPAPPAKPVAEEEAEPASPVDPVFFQPTSPQGGGPAGAFGFRHGKGRKKAVLYVDCYRYLVFPKAPHHEVNIKMPFDPFNEPGEIRGTLRIEAQGYELGSKELIRARLSTDFKVEIEAVAYLGE